MSSLALTATQPVRIEEIEPPDGTGKATVQIATTDGATTHGKGELKASGEMLAKIEGWMMRDARLLATFRFNEMTSDGIGHPMRYDDMRVTELVEVGDD